jgi:hypothetical protein
VSESWSFEDPDAVAKEALLQGQVSSLVRRAGEAGLSIDEDTAHAHIISVTVHREVPFTIGSCLRSRRLYRFLESVDLLLHYGDAKLRMDAAITAAEIAKAMPLTAEPAFELFNNMLQIHPQTENLEEWLADWVYDPADCKQTTYEEVVETIRWSIRPLCGWTWPPD